MIYFDFNKYRIKYSCNLLSSPKVPNGESNLESSKRNLEFLPSNCLAGLKRGRMVLVLFIHLFGICSRPKIFYLVMNFVEGYTVSFKNHIMKQ